MKPAPELQDPVSLGQKEEPNPQPSELTAKLSPLESAKLRAQELRQKVGNWADKSRFSGAPGTESSVAISAEARLRSSAPGGSQTPDDSTIKSGQKEERLGEAKSPTSEQSSSSAAGGPTPSETTATQDAAETATHASSVEEPATNAPGGEAASAAPAQPTEPVQSAQSEQQAQLAQPAQPVQPAQPAQPTIQIITNIREPEEKTQATPPPADEQQGTSTSWTHPQFMRRAVQEVACVMPSFQVNDDSRVEVVVSSHEFETSMARNDFSSQSTEGSM